MLSLFQSRSFVTLFFRRRFAFFQFLLLLSVLLPSKFALVSTFIDEEKGKQNRFKQHGGVRRLIMKGTSSIQAQIKLTRHCCSLLPCLDQDAPPTTHPLPHTCSWGQRYQSSTQKYQHTRTQTHTRVVAFHGNDDYEQSMAHIFSSFRSSTGQYSSSRASRHSCQESVLPLSF